MSNPKDDAFESFKQALIQDLNRVDVEGFAGVVLSGDDLKSDQPFDIYTVTRYNEYDAQEYEKYAAMLKYHILAIAKIFEVEPEYVAEYYLHMFRNQDD